MDRGYVKICWGVFIATFNLTFGNITILPAFIGWLLILMGLNTLRENSVSASYDRARIYATLLVFVSLAGSLLTLFSGAAWNNRLVFLYYPLIPLMLELLLMFNLLEGSGESLRYISRSTEKERIMKVNKNYLIMVLIAAIMIFFALTANNELASVLGAIVAVISRIVLLDTFNGLKRTWREYEHTETTDPTS